MVEPVRRPQPKKSTSGEENGFSDSDNLETKLIRLIEANPFATIREMKAQINIRSSFIRVSWWDVFKSLKKMGLLTKKSRFRYVRDLL